MRTYGRVTVDFGAIVLSGAWIKWGRVQIGSARRLGNVAGALLMVVLAGCSVERASEPEQRGTVATPAAEDALLFGDFSQLPNGPVPDRFTTGQPASLAPTADPSWTLRVERGRLTYTPTTEGPAAGYLRTPDLGRPIVRMGMEWTVDPGPGGGPGVAAMGIMGAPVNPLDGIGSPMSMHFLARRDIWDFSVSPGPFGGDPRLITIAGGTFDPPLVEDGVTAYRIDVDIDGPNATVHLPNGAVSHLSDPRIASWAGRFGFFEAYSESGLNDGRVGLIEVWADT